MERFLKPSFPTASQFLKLDKQTLAYRIFPFFILEFIRLYLRVQVEGEKHIPLKGPAIVVANHSGFMGFDALMLGHSIFRATRRVSRIMAHKLWFFHPKIAVQAKRFGLVPATFENGLKILKEGDLLLLFPEGEEGNFKPSYEKYKLKRFRRGFIRLALTTGCPIIPATVVGAEETHITLSQIRVAKPLLGTIIPVPLNVIPFPAKWYIKFFSPVLLGKNKALARNIEEVTRMARRFQVSHQRRLTREVKKRDHVFL